MRPSRLCLAGVRKPLTKPVLRRHASGPTGLRRIRTFLADYHDGERAASTEVGHLFAQGKVSADQRAFTPRRQSITSSESPSAAAAHRRWWRPDRADAEERVSGSDRANLTGIHLPARHRKIDYFINYLKDPPNPSVRVVSRSISMPKATSWEICCVIWYPLISTLGILPPALQ